LISSRKVLRTLCVDFPLLEAGLLETEYPSEDDPSDDVWCRGTGTGGMGILASTSLDVLRV
jgi:hypothetical protein